MLGKQAADMTAALCPQGIVLSVDLFVFPGSLYALSGISFCSHRIARAATSEQGDDWCPGWPGMEKPKSNGNRNGNNDNVGAAVEAGGCCFVLSVADTHDTSVGDRSAPFCIAGSSAEGDGGDTADNNGGGGGATLDIVKFPSGHWETGTVEEVRFRTRRRRVGPRSGVGCTTNRPRLLSAQTRWVRDSFRARLHVSQRRQSIRLLELIDTFDEGIHAYR